jgi:DNA mismatch repair protein MutL
LLSTLRSKFLTTDLNTRAQTSDSQALAEPVAHSGGEDPSGGHDAARAEQMRQELVDWAKGKVAGWDSKALAEPVAPSAGVEAAAQPALFGEPGAGERKPLGLYSLDPVRAAAIRPLPERHAGSPIAPERISSGVPISEEFSKRASVTALQIHNRYLVTESDEGVMVIDQHALHERILYEQLRHRLNANAMETQNLLVPEPVDLSAAEVAAALENRDLLARLGMKIEPFGGDTILVVGYPAMLANINPVELLRELLDRLMSGGRQPERRDLLDELLHTIACKAAIKAGDRLKPEEIAALLEQRHLVDDAHHCPHGRPAALVFTREELDRQFKRM